MHNNYLTLPVVFLMIANHYPLMFATRFNWLIVAIVLAIGPVIRHFFNSRHEGKGSPWWTWAVAAAGMVAVAWLSGAGPRETASGTRAHTLDVRAAQDAVLSRCSMCHMNEPVWPGVHGAPKGVVLDSPESMSRHARLIEIQAVRSDAMPPGNITADDPAGAPDPRRLARRRRAFEVGRVRRACAVTRRRDGGLRATRATQSNRSA